MDSGNSGSMQSSGGEENYDPHAAADSSFNPFFNNLSPPPPTTMYDPSSNLSNFYNPPFSSRPQLQHQQQLTNPFYTPQSQALSFHPHHFKQNQTPQPRNETTAVLSASSSHPSIRQNDQDQTTQVPRNPKKRSRASRRAPTTVLTTDTTNFRAMVQEFTGIPAPPFTQSSPFPRNRLDLFTTPSSFRSNINNITQTSSSYNTLLLRPLAQKLQPPRSSSTFFNDANNNIILSAQSPLLFSNTSELGFLKHHPRGMIQMQNPSQSNNFLHPSISNSSNFSLGMPSQSNLKTGALEEFGLSYGQANNAQLTGLPDLISPENGNNNYVRNSTNGKQNTNFHDGKRTTTESVSASAAARGTCEGMMEPWICSSE